MNRASAFLKKHHLTFVKITVLAIATSIIFLKINGTELSFPTLKINTVVFLLLLSIFNWGFEIKKWKILVKTVAKINYKTALSQTLAAHTAAITTPNKIGEYGAKALFFKKPLRKKIVGLTFITNAFQLSITVLFGGLGFVFYKQIDTILHVNTVTILAIYICIGIGVYYFLSKTTRLKKITSFLKKISAKTQIQIGFYSLLRYLLFSFQYYYFLRLLGVHNSYTVLFPLIWLMYFISSCIPSFSLADFAIKGSVALFLFSQIGIPESTIVAISFFMWLLNFALPAVIGGVFIVRFKTENQLGYDTH